MFLFFIQKANLESKFSWLYGGGASSPVQSGATALDNEFALAVLEQVNELKKHLKKSKNPDSMAEMRSGDDGYRLSSLKLQQ